MKSVFEREVIMTLEQIKVIYTNYSELDKLKEILKPIIFAEGEKCFFIEHEKLCEFIKQCSLEDDRYTLSYEVDLELHRLTVGYNNGCKIIMIATT
jgi:hypothetical protein